MQDSRIDDGADITLLEVVALFRFFGCRRCARRKAFDAPETDQTCSAYGQEWPCGRTAAEWLKDYLRRQQVDCVGHAHDRYGRLLAVCYAGGEVGKHGTRQQVVAAYRDNLLCTPSLLNRLDELHQHLSTLPRYPQACHGDVLAEMINGGAWRPIVRVLLAQEPRCAHLARHFARGDQIGAHVCRGVQQVGGGCADG
jgi:hypothetical protein